MPPRLRFWTYVLALAAFIALLGFLPDYVRTRQFKYTASEIKGSDIRKLPMDRSFPVLSSGGNRREVTLSELAKDHPGGLLINFWATWCPPCIEEMPSLEQLDRQLKGAKDSNLPRLVTISVDEKLAEITALYRTLNFTPGFLVLHDKDALFAESIGSIRFPETYWVAQDGTIRYKWLGPQDWLSDGVLRRLASP